MLNPSSQLFVASAFKAYVLAEYLRQAEAALDPGGAVPLRQQLATHLAEEWALDASVYSLDSAVFNPREGHVGAGIVAARDQGL